jgi:hypothetical protein
MLVSQYFVLDNVQPFSQVEFHLWSGQSFYNPHMKSHRTEPIQEKGFRRDFIRHYRQFNNEP